MLAVVIWFSVKAWGVADGVIGPRTLPAICRLRAD